MHPRPASPSPPIGIHRRASFPALTILELLVSLAIFASVMLVIAQAITTIQATWIKTRARADGYRNTRIALDTIARRITQATLASYWITPEEPAGSEPQRHSHLHFISGDAQQLIGGETIGHAIFFQAPFGQSASSDTTSASGAPAHEHLTETLNAWGYFVESSSDRQDRPDFLANEPDLAPPKTRFRLMEFRQPTAELTLLKMQTLAGVTAPKPQIDSEDSPRSWFATPLGKVSPKERHVSLLADNIVALIIRPLPRPSKNLTFAPATSYEYDSRPSRSDLSPQAIATRHRLPPAVQLIALAISEDHLQHLEIDPGKAAAEASQLRSLIRSKFQDTTHIDEDLTALERELTQRKIPHALVTQTVPIPEGN